VQCAEKILLPAFDRRLDGSDDTNPVGIAGRGNSKPQSACSRQAPANAARMKPASR
jgi:hypothetical protein